MYTASRMKDGGIALLFDITTSDTAYEWILDVLGITGRELIDSYIIENHNNLDGFIEQHLEKIQAIDINTLEFVAFHLTSNSDQCKAIRKSGIKNLQKVLSEPSELSLFLTEQGVKLDIKNKKMSFDGQEFDIDYEKYKGNINESSLQKEALGDIARKIYFDFPINGFFFNHNIYDYGTNIDKCPEFLFTLSSLALKDISERWSKTRQGYVIKYKANIKQFHYGTFYAEVDDYLLDSQTGWIQLRKWLVSNAVNCAFSNRGTDIYAYMNPDEDVEPKQIIGCFTTNEWQRIDK